MDKLERFTQRAGPGSNDGSRLFSVKDSDKKFLMLLC